MFHSHPHQQKITISPNSRADILSAIDNDTKNFMNRLAWLQDKWGNFLRKAGDCHESRIMIPVIIGTLTPLNASIIADNLAYFKKKFESGNSKQDYRQFQIACLCGSEHIADFLFNQLEIKPDYSTILTYVSASQNEEWVTKISTVMKDKNLPMPDGIYLYCTENNIKDAIKDTFGVSIRRSV